MRQVVAGAVDFTDDHFSLLTENVLLLRQVEHRGRLCRLLAVLKLSLSGYDSSLREFTIAPERGIRVLTPDESGGGVLAGITERDSGLTGALAADAVVIPATGGTPPAREAGED